MNNIEIACVIDRSGSMSTIVDDAIGGFNTFLADQKKDGEANFTLVLFDHEYKMLHDGEQLSGVPELTTDSYVPRGMTALYDAIGRTIVSLGKRYAESTIQPDKVIFVILTDGEENASTDYAQKEIAEMIKHQESKYAWDFIFLAANQDAFATAQALNIKSCNTEAYTLDEDGIQGVYASVSERVKKLKH